MKRRIASDHSFGGILKRRSSSLFSIDTINESPSRPPSELNLSNNLHPKDIIQDSTSTHVCSNSISSPSATETEVSSTDGAGFYIDEDLSDDDTGNDKIIPTVPSDIKTEKVVETQSSHVDQTGDLRTGVVFESGSKHFDRHNRLHKERPVRVTSIMDALQKSNLQDKFTVLDDIVEDSSPEKLFLDDDDYLQVHLPGYMKR